MVEHPHVAYKVRFANFRHIRMESNSWAAVAYWLERQIRDRNEDFEREFDSPLTHTLSKVRDAQ